MPITSSQLVEDRTQVDGRRYVTEVHIDHTGVQHRFTRLVDAGHDANAAMTARAAALVTHLRDMEIESNLNELAENNTSAMRLIHSTLNQNGIAARARFARLVGRPVGYFCKWFLARTDAQLAAWFELTAPQVAILRTRLQDRADKQDAADRNAGE